MRHYIISLALAVLAASCQHIDQPEKGDGSLYATFATTSSVQRNEGQIAWNVGDKVVLSNCKEEVAFSDGEMVESANAECFEVTPEMLSQDQLTIHFKPGIPKSGKYAILTARDFSEITGIGKDGSVHRQPRKESTELNYIASAVSEGDKLLLEGVDNIFSISITDRRVKYLDVSVGYSDFEIKSVQAPATYYFPLGKDEELYDGIYAYAYDESCDRIFTDHFTDIAFDPNRINDLGVFFDAGDADRDIIREILKDNDAVEASYCLEGDVLHKYLTEVEYDDDYSYTKIKNYAPKSNERECALPAYVPVKDLKDASKIYLLSDYSDIHIRAVTSKEKQAVYSLIPGRIYKWGVVSVDADGKEKLLKKGCFQTEGHLRVIKTKYIHNVRDVGGWEGLDGKHIKYGILIRGAEVEDRDHNLTKYDDFDYEAIVNEVGVDFDMDFRNDDEVGGIRYSPFGVEYTRIPLSAYDSIVRKKDRQVAFKKAILKFIDNAKKGKCTYVHCQGGADRTGTFVFFIEGLLGVSDSDLCKDYEITSFYYHKERNDPERYLPMVKALLSMYSQDGTVGNAILNCSLSMGLTQQDIQDLRDLMLE